MGYYCHFKTIETMKIYRDNILRPTLHSEKWLRHLTQKQTQLNFGVYTCSSKKVSQRNHTVLLFLSCELLY